MLRRKRSFTQRSLRPSVYRASREQVEPFHVTFFKVGSTILALSVVAYLVCVSFISPKNAYDDIPYREHLLVKHTDADALQTAEEENKVAILPSFTLSKKSQGDAFGIAEEHLSQISQDAPKEVLQFLDAAEQLRNKFSERYGGVVSARALLERSLTVFKKESSSNALAFRIDNARRKSGVLRMAFGGGGSAAGYGNFFHQSFPFVVESLLTVPLELLGLTLQVRNGAVEHTSVFPYTWCQSKFLGDALDVSSMDFGSLSLQQLETVIRNMSKKTDQETPPILVVRDSLRAKERISLLQSYVDADVLVDPIVIDLQGAYAPFQNVREDILPPGFQGWNKFGAPPGAPGKIRQNMTMKQHELYGWLLSMHILTQAELVVRNMLNGLELISAPSSSETLPRPQFNKRLKMNKWTPLLYGTPTDESYKEWIMSSIECRTAFDPVVSQGSLGDVIIGGTAGDDVDLLHPKGTMYLSQGWVLDLEAAERREKQLMKQWDNLGFQDYAKSYYGVPASGPLSIFLPADNYNQQQKAKEVFKYLIICESNTKGNGCNLERDVTFTVGGVDASVQWILEEAVAYHGKRLCVLVDIPEEAKLVSKQVAKQDVVERIAQVKRDRQEVREDTRTLEITTVGLALDIKVTNSLVTWHKGTCSIAHLIWESTSAK